MYDILDNILVSFNIIVNICPKHTSDPLDILIILYY